MANTSPSLRRLIAIGTFAACTLGLCLVANRSGSVVMAKANPVVQSYSFMPGQSMNFPNRKYRKIEVRSTFPVRVLTGPCHEENVVQFFCNSQPGDIFITDLRGKPLFRTPEANQITITEIKK